MLALLLCGYFTHCCFIYEVYIKVTLLYSVNYIFQWMCNMFYCCILRTKPKCVHLILLVFLIYIIHCSNCPMGMPSHTHGNESAAMQMT